ncbi:MAG: SDR family oxidoreductase [Candidatus Dadabacteria bacterium]|nr:SDR family oxidoreductase [Candidatus Dadabacteria bacterium]
MKSFQGKTALITGGSSGIGRVTAIAFAREGAKVVVASRREEEGKETIRLIEQAGSKGIFLKTDVTKESEVEALIDKAQAVFGRIDCAFNNAGVLGPISPLVEQKIEDYESIINTNLKGVFLCMKHEIAHMLKIGGGAIVNNSSVGGLVGFPGGAIYVASKHAVLGLTKTAALEVAKSGIRINAVSPAGIETDMADLAIKGVGITKEQFAAMHPVGRMGTPEEIAGAVLYLCSDGASFITGQSLTLDGGYTAQ